MKICLAQVRSAKGHLQENIDHHMRVLTHLEAGAADLVVFPELSLTNYDPDIAMATAIAPQDSRLQVFQEVADSTGLTIAVGVPTKSLEKPLISMIICLPNQARRVINKQYLHGDERAFFSPADEAPGLHDMATRIGLAICYEMSVDAHIEAALSSGIDLYLASVAKTRDGMVKAEKALSTKAKRYQVPILVVSCVGTCEGKDAGGGSMAIDPSGKIIVQLRHTDEGLLVYDDVSRTAVSLPGPEETS